MKYECVEIVILAHCVSLSVSDIHGVWAHTTHHSWCCVQCGWKNRCENMLAVALCVCAGGQDGEWLVVGGVGCVWCLGCTDTVI